MVGLWIVVVTLLVLPFSHGEVRSEYRSIDGHGNNIANPTWGKSGTPQLRPPQTSYSDPNLGTLGSINDVSPRVISNRVFDGDSIETQIGASEMLTYWGQFMDHDIVRTPNNREETLGIRIPECDTYFDPNCTSTNADPKFMTIGRSIYTNESAVRTQFNDLSAFMDASSIYGGYEDRALALRTMEGGRLKVTPTAHGDLPPKNTFGFSMDNDARKVPNDNLFFTGDVRGNENPALTSLHTIFLREHNRLCASFAQEHPDWDDETLYQEARRLVIAYMQSINANEYAPAILGHSLPDYKGYNSSINPSIDIIFSSAGFRYGHSEVGDHIMRVDENRNVISNGAIPLRNGYFDPSWIEEDGVEVILRGIVLQPQEAVDVRVVDDLRNFLFGKPGQGGMDLVAINTMRGRDHGIPDYNTIREIYGLPRVTTWAGISSSRSVQDSLRLSYGSVDKIDAYVGGLAEDNVPNANVGPLFQAIYEEQFLRLRDGDRFWYENTEYFTAEEINNITNTKLADLITRNTNIQKIPCFTMFWSAYNDCPNSADSGEGTGDPTTFLVTLSKKTPSNPYYGQGMEYTYFIDGVEAKELSLHYGVNYTFIVQATCAHPFYFTSNEIGNGIDPLSKMACGGRILTFMPTEEMGNLIYYQCMYHQYLGWKINLSAKTASTTHGDSSATVLGISVYIYALLVLFSFIIM